MQETVSLARAGDGAAALGCRGAGREARRYVRRIRSGSTDAALVTGSGKDLLEAVARQVLLDKTGSYDERMGFPGTLFQAFELKGLATPPGKLLNEVEAQLDPDPRRRLTQTLYLLGGCTPVVPTGHRLRLVRSEVGLLSQPSETACIEPSWPDVA
jgi:hypothetical protein